MFLFRSLSSKKDQQELIEFEGMQLQIKRIPRKRSITISVKPNGKGSITAGVGCPRSAIEGFLDSKREWLQSISKKFESLREKYPRLTIEEGTELPLLGEPYKVSIQKSRRKTISLKVSEKNFIMELPDSEENLSALSTQEKLRQTLRKHYRKLGQELLARRVTYWVRQTGFAPKKLGFRSQKTRWGSCSHQGSVTLNWKLVCADPGVIDYVIIHELCHLKHLDHSKNFWRLVETFCPDWREKKKWLRERTFELDFLNESSELHA
jgi:predicted metal-dependent hydrolase